MRTRIILLLTTLFIALQGLAYDFTVGSLCYNINSDGKTASVTCKNESGAAYTGLSGAVTIPSSVTSGGKTYSVTMIGDRAFSKCTGITSVTIPTSVTEIGNSAFSSCSALKSITIPSSVTVISHYAFTGSGLTAVTIPAAMTEVGAFAFYNCPNLAKVTWNATNCTDDTSGTIYQRFSGCPLLTKFVFGSGVKRIPDDLCYNITNLTSVTIPASVTEIGQYAFYKTGLTSVTIPASVTTLGYDAFSMCDALATVNFNATNCADIISKGSPQFLGTPFSICPNLKTVNFGSNVKRIPGGLCGNLKNITSVTLPSALTEIGSYAFDRCTGLTSITFPSTLTTIRSCAFYACSGLTQVTIPATVSLLESGAFFNCTSLAKVTFNATNCQDYSGNNSVFDGCSALKTFTFGSSVKRIPAYLCAYIEAMTSVTIPASVTEIGNSAFEYCTGLTTVTMGTGVTTVYKDAFSECTALNKVSITDLAKWCNIVWNNQPANPLYYGKNLYLNGSKVTSLSIPSTVTTLRSNAFINCTPLTTITIPTSLTSCASSAFSGCTGVTTINWNATQCGDFSSLTRPFSGMTSIKTMTFGNTVTKIPNYLCYNLTGLTTTTIGTAVTSIGANTFTGCTALATVNWNATNCGNFTSSNYPFKDLTGIKTFNFGSAVKTIPAYLCYGLTGLTQVTIPKSVTTSGSNAFSGCTGLTRVNITDLATYSQISFLNSAASPISYGKNLYLNGTIVSKLTIPSTVTNIDSYAYRGCTSITEVSIPKSVTSVGYYAFELCSGLKKVTWDVITHNSYSTSSAPFRNLSGITTFTFGNDVTTIPGYLCYNLTGLTAITIPAAVTAFGTTPFSGCSSLATVNWNATNCGNFTSSNYPFKGLTGIKTFNFGTAIKTIPAYLCYGLTGLTQVTIPKSVTGVGNYAFQNCSALTRLNITDLAAFCAINFSNAYANPIYYAKNLYLNGSVLSKLTIPSSVTTINRYTFGRCTSITEVTIPKTVTQVNGYAFELCSGLKTVTWNVISNSNYTAATAPFNGLTGITAFTFGNDVKTIPSYLCNGLTGISQVNIPASVTDINDNAFNGCTGLTRVNITDLAKWCAINFNHEGNNPLYIAKKLYLNGNLLNEVKIPASVTGISNYAFINAECINNLSIPASVSSLGYSAFAGCKNIRSIISEIEQPSNANYGYSGNNSNLFKDVPATCRLIVPQGSLADYQLANYNGKENPWLRFATVSQSTTGDVNCDGYIDALDVTATVNHIIGQAPALFDFGAADINNDNNVDAIDVTAIIKLILNTSGQE